MALYTFDREVPPLNSTPAAGPCNSWRRRSVQQTQKSF